MLTPPLALLIQMTLPASEAEWHQLTPQEQQDWTEHIIIDDVRL